MKTHLVFRQYVWLLETLQRYKKLTLEEINELWLKNSLSEGVALARSTFNYHRNNIEEMFDINIECDVKDGYKYYIENYETLQTHNVQSFLIESLSVSNALSQTKNISNRIQLEKIPMGQEYLSLVIEALNRNLLLEITYKTFSKDEASRAFLIEPYCLKYYSNRWYILTRRASFHKKIDKEFIENLNDSLRVYSLDRIASMKITNQTFLYYNKFDADEFFRYSFGIYSANKDEARKIIIRVFGNDGWYWRTCPLHESQKLEKESPEYMEFSFFIKPTYDFMMKIMSFGANVEVISPIELRNAMRQNALDCSQIYKEDKK